jgi:stage II sporulation protein AB (anti-sigma F factor)
MAKNNRIKMSFPSNSENVGIARITVAAFSTQANFTLTDIDEIKVAVSEAVSNSIIHGYPESIGQIDFEMIINDECLEFIITDFGRGIADVKLARQPSYSTQPERMGLGFAFMESFMDDLTVESELGRGTTVRMIKKYNIEKAH